MKGRDSRGQLPEVFTTLSDRVAAANSETPTLGQPPLRRAATAG